MDTLKGLVDAFNPHLRFVSHEANVILITADSSLPVGEQGRLLMACEEWLHAKTGTWFEIYSPPKVDENKPRQNREKILDWIRRQEALNPTRPEN